MSPEDSLISRMVVERQIATKQELSEALERQKQLGSSQEQRPLGEILVELGFLTRTQLNRLHGDSEDSGGRPAQQIPGFQLIKKVGAGAMAVVYKAKQLSLDRVVAIKVLPKRMSQNPEFVERFYKEGKAAAALSHNNIVQAIDVGEVNGYHYFVMEFVEGKTVYDELAESKVFGEQEAVKIVRQTAKALLHAHERGIIHRDVKPKNVMITTEGVVKLADMGLARAASDLEAAMQEAGRAYGTPYYISPEQIRGEVNIDHRADIYSLGATFYHMMTGRVPFEGPSPSAVMRKHLKEPLTPPDHLNTKMTAGAAAMIEMMLAKKPADRYPSCKEIIADLELIARGEPPQYASTFVDHSLYESLKHGQEHEQAPAVEIRRTGVPSSVAVTLAVILGLSLLGNLILAVMLAK